MFRCHMSLHGVVFNEIRGRFYLTGIEHFVSSKIRKTLKYMMRPCPRVLHCLRMLNTSDGGLFMRNSCILFEPTAL